MPNRLSHNKKPRIAILGHRGIPSSYGGFETLAEELAVRFAESGNQVTVYCRSNLFPAHPKEYRGVHLVHLPTINTQSLATLVHTFLSVFHLIFRNTADVALVVNVGNALPALFARIFGKKVVLCVDGLDWERKKWGMVARAYLKLSSHVARFAAHRIVTDAGSVQAFYEEQRHTASTHIPYGTDIEPDGADGAEHLAKLGLTAKNYFIFVARFERENNPLKVVQAYGASKSGLPLVMIGDNPYDKEYVAEVKAAGGERVIFLGYVFGERYKALLKHALAYVRAAEVGGISPAVVEAMGRGVCVVGNDKPENREPLGDTGLFFDLKNPSTLTAIFKDISTEPDKAVRLGRLSASRALLYYSWDAVAFAYMKVMEEASGVRRSEGARPARLRFQGRRRLLITGAEGMLGEAFVKQFEKDCDILSTTRTPRSPGVEALDVADEKAFTALVKRFRPQYIAHLAAITNLEECDRNLSTTYAVNTLSVKYAARAAARHGAKLIYPTTSGVFDGTKAFYRDDDEAHPQNVYALTKHMGALMAEHFTSDALIIRLGWVMGGGPGRDKKFVGKIIEQIMNGKRELHALTDKSGSLSYTHDVAKNVALLLDHAATGTYNMVCEGFATRHEVAEEIIRILGWGSAVTLKGVDSSFFANTFTVVRSASECLVNERLTREGFNTMRPWREALASYLERDFTSAFYTGAPPAPAQKRGRARV